MKVTLNGIEYEGTVAEIRDIVSNPPNNFTYSNVPQSGYASAPGEPAASRKRVPDYARLG